MLYKEGNLSDVNRSTKQFLLIVVFCVSLNSGPFDAHSSTARVELSESLTILKGMEAIPSQSDDEVISKFITYLTNEILYPQILAFGIENQITGFDTMSCHVKKPMPITEKLILGALPMVGKLMWSNGKVVALTNEDNLLFQKWYNESLNNKWKQHFEYDYFLARVSKTLTDFSSSRDEIKLTRTISYLKAVCGN